MTDVKIRAGQTLHIEVDYVGEPEPAAVWKRDGTALKSDTKRTTVTAIGHHTIIHAVNAVRGDSGEYVLNIKNESGSDTGSLLVCVLGKDENLLFAFLLKGSQFY